MAITRVTKWEWCKSAKVAPPRWGGGATGTTTGGGGGAGAGAGADADPAPAAGPPGANPVLDILPTWI